MTPNLRDQVSPLQVVPGQILDTHVGVQGFLAICGAIVPGFGPDLRSTVPMTEERGAMGRFVGDRRAAHIWAQLRRGYRGTVRSLGPARPDPGEWRSSCAQRVILGAFMALLVTACQPPPTAAPARAPQFDALRVVTFNVGSGRAVEEVSGNAGYGPAEADRSDRWYGNGLAWPAVMRDVQAFFDEVDADIVALQEVFYSGQCGDIPVPARQGFVCENWQPGDRTVAQSILGDAYQVACHPGKPDKCLALHRRLGRFEGCADVFCLHGLEVLDEGVCGSGNRVAAASVQLASGGSLRIVHIHGTSGLARTDAACRFEQVESVFAAGGAAPEFGIVLGDFNTDPGRTRWLDQSARALWRFTTPPGKYRFMTEVGLFVRPTIAPFFNIDHILAAGMRGECWGAGVTRDRPPVSDLEYLDHTAIVCDLWTLE